jgi:hypothetical protein
MRRLLSLLLLVAVLPAQAALFDDEEARKRIEALRTEVNARMDKLEAASRGQIELANQIEALKQEVAKLRGQIEVLTNEIESTQKRQKDFYVDLDNRLRKLEAPPAETKPAEAKPASDPAAETRDYEAALESVQVGQAQGRARRLPQFHQGLAGQPLPALGALLGRQRPLPARRVQEGHRTLRQAGRRLARRRQGARRPARRGQLPAGVRRRQGRAQDPGNPGRQISRQRRRGRRQAAPGPQPSAAQEVAAARRRRQDAAA